MKKILLTILICGICTFTLTGCFNNRNFELTIPKEGDIKSISLGRNDSKVDVSNTEDIKDIIGLLNGSDKRITKEESIQDYPVNADEVIKIEFNFKEKGNTILFVYKKDEKMFIESPYNGIYKISDDEYNSIEKYIKNSKDSSGN